MVLLLLGYSHVRPDGGMATSWIRVFNLDVTATLLDSCFFDPKISLLKPSGMPHTRCSKVWESASATSGACVEKLTLVVLGSEFGTSFKVTRPLYLS